MTDRDGSPAGVASVSTVDAAAVLARHTRGGMARDLMGDLFCGTCSQPWLGPIRTGGCEAVLLARRVIELEAALAKWDRWANPPFIPGAAWPVGEE